MVERERREAAYAKVYARWEDADERLPLLMQLRWEVARSVRGRLGDTETPLTDDDCDHMLRFLQGVMQYAADDMPIAALRAKVEILSQRDSAL